MGLYGADLYGSSRYLESAGTTVVVDQVDTINTSTLLGEAGRSYVILDENGLPVEPTTWSLFTVTPNRTTIQALLTQARSRTLTFDLSQPHTLSFTIDGEHPEADLINELQTDIIVTRNNTKLFRGRVGSTSDDVDQNKHTVSFQAVSYKGLLGRRTLQTDKNTLATAEDQAYIAWWMVNHTQTQSGGNLSITAPDTLTTGVLRGDLWEAGKYIANAIDDIGSRQYGFEWDIDADLRMQIYYPNRGAVSTYVAEYGGFVTSFQRTLDTSNYANFVRSFGTNGGLDISSTSSMPNIADLIEGRWEYAEGGGDADSTAEVASRAAGLLGERGALTPTYTLTLKDGTWRPEQFWLGDSINVVIKKGRLDVNSFYRVQRIQIDIGDSNEEHVTVTV